jgi:TM2 domain-containing membrane protein YozV
MSTENIQNQADTNQSKKSRIVGAILCFIFGWLGVHRFYVGKVGTGILMILWFLFLYTVAPVIFGIMFLAGTTSALSGDSGGVGTAATGLGAMIYIIPVSLLWWLIDFVLILAGKFKDSKKLEITKW